MQSPLRLECGLKLLVMFWVAQSCIFAGDFLVERETDLEFTPAYDLVEVELGNLPPKAVGDVVLVVHNPSSNAIELGTFTTGCKCLTTSLSETTLAGKGSVTMRLRLETPSRPKSVEQQVSVTLGTNKELNGRTAIVRLNYRIAGLVAFQDARAVISANEGDEQLTFRLPLIAENRKYLMGNAVQIRPSGKLQGMETKIVEEQDKFFVRCKLDMKKVDTSGASAEITLDNQATGLTDTILCVIAVNSIVTISPDPIRLKWSDDEQCYHASVMIRVVPPSDTQPKLPERGLESSESLSVRSSLSGSKIRVSTTEMLTKGLARVKLAIAPDEERAIFESMEHKDGMLWVIRYRSKEYIEKTRFRFGSSFVSP